MGKGTSSSSSSGGRPDNSPSEVSAEAATASHNFSPENHHQQCKPNNPHLPSMIVFDLDDCLWTPEMHELSGLPSVPIEGPLDPDGDFSTTPLGTVSLAVPQRRRNGRGARVPSWELDDGYDSGSRYSSVRLYDGARRALRALALNPKYRGIVLACASSSLEPTYSHACLDHIEILPDLTLRDMFAYHQIGRTGKLTPRKTSHFRELHLESGIPYDRMLFFDDCNWGDHVGDLRDALGVVGQRTPNGLTFEEFERGLDEFRRESERAL